MSWGVVVSHQRLPWPLRSWILPLLCLGLAGLASARHPQQIHPGLPGVCRAIISKVQSYTESNLQSSLVGVKGGICTWLELNGCQQYKVVFTPVYKVAFRTVYVSGFVCCSGYTRVGNSCVPNQPTTAVPPMPTPSRPPGSTHPVTGPPPGSDNDQDGSTVPGFTGLFMTARPVTPPPGPSTKIPATDAGLPKPERTPGAEVDPPGPRDRLLIILLVLVILVALFAIASFAFHLAKLWHRGRLACCFGILSLPRIRNGRDVPEDSQKINCILSTISSDCSTESVRSDLSTLSHRSGSDQSGRSGCSEVTFISDDSDSGIVKHVVYERCWKDTASLLPYASSSSSSSSFSQTSRESRSKVTGLMSKKCTPLLTIPLTPLAKKRRPSPPLPIRPEPIYDTTPRSPPLPVPVPHTKRSSPIPRQPSPGPYSYTSLNKRDRKNPSPRVDIQSPVGRDFAVGPSQTTTEDYTQESVISHRYINVKSAVREKLRPVYVTLDPETATDSVYVGTECCEGDDDPWMTSHSPESSSISSVGYCALSNQVFPHRVSGNGYDKLERCGQNLPLAPESFPAPEYAVPSVTTSTSCLVVETETEDLECRASPDIRRSGTFSGMTLEYRKLSEDIKTEDTEQEERYIRAPRHNHKELVFIDTVRRVKISTPTMKHNSVG